MSDGEESGDNKLDMMMISVAARIPEFWTDQPSLWFVQYEAAVAPQKASDDAKFQLLIAKLGKQVILQVADLLTSPPTTNKYDALKARLLNVYEESENKKIQKLLGDMQLGDQKPSQLLRRMQTYAGSRVSKETLLVLWQNHLPAAVRTVLAATAIDEPTKLAEVADKIQETNRPIDMAGVSQVDQCSLADMVAKLSIEVAELRRSSRSPKRFDHQKSQVKSSSRARSVSRRRKDYYAARERGLCFYHARFATKATRCVKPCSWKGNDQGNEDQCSSRR